MTVLSDYTIKSCIDGKHIGVFPYDPNAVQPASLDLKLGSTFRYFEMGTHEKIDVREDVNYMMREVKCSSEFPFILHPGQFVLGNTVERVALPDDITARLDGKSSLARLGLVIHSAGWIDPGFEGTITLELANLAPLPITLVPMMPVGQISFMRMDRRVSEPYQGKYQGQADPAPSRMHENFTDDDPDDFEFTDHGYP